MADRDAAFMQEALDLAERGRGWVEPNPLVGAVVVQGDRVVGRAYHQRFGGPHAEVLALDEAGSEARGATLYVTLEPCCHHGKTPPCTDRILASRVRRLVVAMQDPFLQVSGKGLAILRSAGLEVVVGPGQAQARQLNAPYLKLLSTGRPYVHAKWAMTLDGKVASASGESKWITSDQSRRHGHQFRGLVDAIVIGLGTALADDPQLTARPDEFRPASESEFGQPPVGPARRAARVVLDSRARLPLGSRLVQTARGAAATLVATTSAAPTENLERLREAGCECLVLPSAGERVDVLALLDELGRRRWTNLLVEGGPTVLGAFLEAGQIDAVGVYVAPRLLGGQSAPGPVAGPGFSHLARAIGLSDFRATPLGPDLFLQASTSPE